MSNKRSSFDLAPRKIPFHQPSIDERDIDAVTEVLHSGWITSGPRTREFEREFAEHVGASHAVAVNSCTAALHLALAGEDLGPGDEVITTPYTFIATVEAICYLGARPVLVDIEPVTRNIDPSAIEERITERTKAIVPVHIAGLPCDMDPILEIAERHGLAVIEDAAHSLPASYKGRSIGSIGKATCFSFYATKNLTTAEGGMVTTSNPELAERYRRMSLHGIDKSGWKRYEFGGSWFYDVQEMGYKYNLTDMAAAIGLTQLEKLDQFDRRRCEIADRYARRLHGIEGLELPHTLPDRHHAWHLYIIGVTGRCGSSRDELIQRLSEQGVATSVHFIPVHYHSYYGRQLGYRRGEFPHAESAFQRAVSLPLYPAMADEDVDYVADAVRRILRA